MSEKQRFQEILREIRSDMKFLKEDLFNELSSRVLGEVGSTGLYGEIHGGFIAPSELKNWIFDVFLDKCYEIEAKILKIIDDLGFKATKLTLDSIKGKAREIACGTFSLMQNIRSDINALQKSINDYETDVESLMSNVRQKLYQDKWANVQNLKTEDYVIPTQRARYVQARDDLEKAKKAVKDKQWDEVLNHLRPAIDLAIKEKFGFKKIQPMKQFLKDADKYGLPLPTYTMLYDYFDEGSQRIHECLYF